MATAAEIRDGLIRRGLPAHVADGFVMNMQDESGLNPGINEAAPVVPGSRGGFGLYQLTGPRRTAYEQFASQRGVLPDDVDAQLDFLMEELRGTERRAAESIMATSDAGQAAAAILNDFLRPAEEHRRRREASYLGQDTNNVLTGFYGSRRNRTPGVVGEGFMPSNPMRDRTPGVTTDEYTSDNVLARNIGGERYTRMDDMNTFLSSQTPNILDPRAFMRPVGDRQPASPQFANVLGGLRG